MVTTLLPSSGSDEERVMLVGCGCKGSNHYEVITTTDWIQKAAGIRLDCLNVLEMDKGVRDALILGKLNATVC